ncbi:spermidine synthase [Streptomyces sp. NBC_01262]|uniref:spermidine synthase n=1 Tax=Streptomyces sp. NBC_01262 TaxID=2903803 RepID=UPI002E331AE4|nr:hypothetical protein [Streptomyces sp. NBC_01262]
MFYSNGSLLINTIESTLSGDRIFTGNQPDDFALVGLLRGARSACLLGVGYGGSIRAMLAGNPALNLALVDNDDVLLNFTGQIFQRNFPGLNFTTEVADAWDHLRDRKAAYDVICVDLYSLAGYPEFVFHGGFWEDVRSALAPGGHVVANAWGLPEQLRPLTPPSPQHGMARAMLGAWTDLNYLPCRRNLTFVAPALAPTDLRPAVDVAPDRLSHEDFLTLGLQRVRFGRAPVLRPGDLSEGTLPQRDRRDIDAEMAVRWPEMVADVTKGSEPAAGDLQTVLSDRDLATAATRQLLAAGSPTASFIPCIAGATAQLGELRMSWYGDWICDEGPELKALAPDWYYLSGLWQALCMARTPLGAKWPWESRLFDGIFGELLDDGDARGRD